VRDPGLTIVDMLDWLYAKKQAPLTIVECGTIRNPTFEGHEDGLATYHIAKWSRDNGGHSFTSIELSHGTLVASQAFIDSQYLELFVKYSHGDATLVLEHWSAPIDFCYLDAGADPVANLAQYRHACTWLRSPGAIVIDDVFDPRNANRGLVTVPFARLEGRKVACLDGRQALISFGVDDYPLPEGSYWL
jgi:predicted O-methyltransferase YrrM